MLAKTPLLRMLKVPAVGRPAAALAWRAGARRLSHKISGLCDYVPPIVTVELPAWAGPDKRFRMYGHGGRDSVARTLWRGGWWAFEPPMPALFAALARDARWVLDVGSYSGFYTLVATTVSPSARVLAFDPFPQAQRLIEANLELNNRGDRVRLLRGAASDKPGTAPLYIPEPATRMIETASSLGSEFRHHHQQVLEVKVTTLDEAVAENQATPVDLIKLDVEGVECAVLRGSAGLLREQRPVIFLEILPGFDDGTLDAIAAEFDYACGLLTDRELLWPEKVKAHPQFTNQVFCPREKVDQVGKVAAEVCAIGQPSRPQPAVPAGV